MFAITITSPNIVERQGVGKVSNKPYHLRIQTGYLHTVGDDGNPNEIPDKFEFLLDKDQAPYPRGRYQLHPSAVQVSRDGGLEVRARLAPVAAPAAPASKA